MGFRPSEEELKDLLLEIDEDGSGEIEFGEFCQLCATFLVEDPDMETMKRELKDAFRYTQEDFFPQQLYRPKQLLPNQTSTNRTKRNKPIQTKPTL